MSGRLTRIALGEWGLEALSLAAATRQQYATALRRFLAYASTTLSDLAKRRSRSVDRLLVDYLNHLFNTDDTFARASHTVFGLVAAIPELQYKLPRSRRALKGWDRHRVHRSHPPLTWELTVVIAVTMARQGFDAEAVATLLAFDCYLRISEYTHLQRCDIAIARDHRMGEVHKVMALRLANTKTGPNRYVTIQSELVATALQSYLDAHHFHSEQLVFPFTSIRYRTCFHRVCEQLGLGAMGIVPHSLRHGGATHDFLCGASIEQVQHRGRWASSKSATRYVQQLPAMLMQTNPPPSTVQLGRVLAPHVAAALSHLRARSTSVPIRAAYPVRFADTVGTRR